MARTPASRVLLALLLALLLVAPAEGGPPPPAGIRWEPSVPEALDRAAQEGRPVLLCVNALEEERANQALATTLYPSPAWGEATRGFLCLVANPGQHGDARAPCARYGGIPCRAHRDALDLAMTRFGADLVSPQHVVLEPDGAVLWRREYFSGDFGPDDLLALLVRCSPRAATRRAALARADRVRALEAAPADAARAAAEAWIAEGDPLAAAGVAAVLDAEADEGKRRALVAALGRAPEASDPVLLEAADLDLMEPEAAPAVVAAWREALGPRAAAAPALARAALRTRDEALRRSLLAAVEAHAPALAREARLLAGERRPEDRATAGAATLRAARAEARAGLREHAWPPLAEVLAAPEAHAPGDLRGALLEASAAEVRPLGERVVALLAGAREERVRLAAALALLRAGIGAEGAVADAIAAALPDAVEGPETRAEAVARLGADPGDDPEAFREALRRASGGGR